MAKAPGSTFHVSALPRLCRKIGIGLHELPADASEVLFLGKPVEIGLGQTLFQNIVDKVGGQFGDAGSHLVGLGLQALEALSGFSFLADRSAVKPVHFILRHEGGR